MSVLAAVDKVVPWIIVACAAIAIGLYLWRR
jgi:hypothetical protein